MPKLTINANDAFSDAWIIDYQELQRIGTDAPFPIATLKPGMSVEIVNVYVAEPFAGTTATIEVSDSTDPTGATLIAPVGLDTVFNEVNTGADYDTSDAVSYFTKTANGAYIGGDQTGDARGSEALDVQSGRFSPNEVADGIWSTTVGARGNKASGRFSSAVGSQNTASIYGTAFGYRNTAGEDASAVGYNNTASGDDASAIGYSNDAGDRATAVGYSNTGSALYSSAVGRENTASGISSSAFGHRCRTTIDNTVEAGCWVNSSTRLGSIRAHPNGQIALTIEDSGTAPTDGGATAGDEADGTLPRSMYAIQKNGNDVTLYYNNAGTIQSLSLGTLT